MVHVHASDIWVQGCKTYKSLSDMHSFRGQITYWHHPVHALPVHNRTPPTLRLARLGVSSAAMNSKGAGAWKLAGAVKTVMASVDRIDEAARERCIFVVI